MDMMRTKNSAAQGRHVRVFHGTARVRGEGDEPARIEGIGIRYGVVTPIGPAEDPYFYEEWAPGSLLRSEGRDIVSRVNHQTSALLGRESNGTLSVRETEQGVEYSVQPNMDTQVGRDAMAYARRGDFGGASVEFRDDAVEVRKNYRDGKPLYVVKRAFVGEIGPVSAPAVLSTTAEARDAEACMQRRDAMVMDDDRVAQDDDLLDIEAAALVAMSGAETRLTP